MYHFHHTIGIIVAARASGEADKRFRLFTRDHGMIIASAKGIRLMSSKLRYALQPYALSNMTLVRGKHGWRVTNAVPLEQSFGAFSGNIDAKRVAAKTFSFLVRFAPEGVPEPFLFDRLTDFLRDVKEGAGDDQRWHALLSASFVRILHAFGYVANDSVVETIVRDHTVDPVLWYMSGKEKIDFAINRGIAESHL